MNYYAFVMTILLLGSWMLSRRDRCYRNLLIGVSTLSYLVYLAWRVTTIPLHDGPISLLAGLLLFLAELMGSVAFFNFQYLFTGKTTPEKKTLTAYDGGAVPTVDVLICTYNEPLYLLEMTIAAAVNLDYPEDRLKVYVCDDGRRGELKKLCRRYGIGYLTRRDNRSAKAGNINNALRQIRGDLFAVLDADMIPKKDFLAKTVGYFSDPKVAFVQTPQIYYNQDIYQYNLALQIPNEQDFFMRDIQAARATKNATLHVGTNAVFRKACVMEIGGYPSYSITEDMAVGMTLQANGYDSVFVNEELVYGLSAATFSELVKQRDRWCRGNLQVIKNTDIIRNKGLSLAQKIAYLDGGLYWLANLQKMIFILTPIFFLLTGLTTMLSRLEVLLPIFLPHVLADYLIFSVLAPKTRSIRWAHYYETIMAPYLSMSIVKELLNLKVRFNVTSKEMTIDKRSFQASIVFPHLILCGLTIFSWGIACSRLMLGTVHWDAYGINFLWSIFNLDGLLVAVRVAWQKPIHRKTERVVIKTPVSCWLRYNGNRVCVHLRDISGCGAGVTTECETGVRAGQNVFLDFGTVQIRCRVARSNRGELGLKFLRVTPEAMKYVMSIFCENMEPYYKGSRREEQRRP